MTAAFEQLTSRVVSAGSWLAFANVRALGYKNSDTQPEIHCEIRDPRGVIGWGVDLIPQMIDDDIEDFDWRSEDRATFAIQGATQASSGDLISLWCRAQGGEDVEIDGQLMLVKVDHFVG